MSGLAAATVTTTTADLIPGSARDLLVSGPDPFDQPVYSLPIPVDPGQVLTVSAVHRSDTVVVAGFKLLAWMGPVEAETKPGVGACTAATLAVEDLDTDVVTTSGEITIPDGIEYLRIVFEIDTCTTEVPGVAVHVASITAK